MVWRLGGGLDGRIIDAGDSPSPNFFVFGFHFWSQGHGAFFGHLLAGGATRHFSGTRSASHQASHTRQAQHTPGAGPRKPRPTHRRKTSRSASLVHHGGKSLRSSELACPIYGRRRRPNPMASRFRQTLRTGRGAFSLVQRLPSREGRSRKLGAGFLPPKMQRGQGRDTLRA